MRGLEHSNSQVHLGKILIKGLVGFGNFVVTDGLGGIFGSVVDEIVVVVVVVGGEVVVADREVVFGGDAVVSGKDANSVVASCGKVVGASVVASCGKVVGASVAVADGVIVVCIVAVEVVNGSTVVVVIVVVVVVAVVVRGSDDEVVVDTAVFVPSIGVWSTKSVVVVVVVASVITGGIIIMKPSPLPDWPSTKQTEHFEEVMFCNYIS